VRPPDPHLRKPRAAAVTLNLFSPNYHTPFAERTTEKGHDRFIKFGECEHSLPSRGAE